MSSRVEQTKIITTTKSKLSVIPAKTNTGKKLHTTPKRGTFMKNKYQVESSYLNVTDIATHIYL